MKNASRTVLKRLKPYFLPILAAAIHLFVNSPALAETYYWNRNERLSSDKDFNRQYNWSASQNGNGKRPISDRDDYFTADALGSAWTTLDLDNDGSTGAASTTASGLADKLTLTGRGGDVWGATNQFYAVYRKDELGNFDISVKVDSLSNTDTWSRAGIIVADTLSSLGNGGFVTLSQTRGNGIVFQSDVAGNIGELEAQPGSVANTTYPVWLRVVKIGLVFGAYYKTSESAAWTEIAFSTTPQGGNLQSQVGLFVCSRSVGSTATAVFDDFQGGGKISQSGYDLVMDGNAGGGDAETHVSADVTAATFTTANYWGQFYWGGNNGLFATYYDNEDFTGTSVARIDTTVNMDWGAGNPSGLSNGDTWSGQLEGYIVSDYSETYTFYVDADDRMRVWVNGTKMFEKWDGCVCSEQTGGSIALTAGVRYPITVQYREDAGSAKLILKWQSASQAKVVVPKRSLFAGHITTTGNTTLTDAPMNAEDGWLEFAGTSGTQVFTPKAGGTLHPNILHSGAGTLQFATNALNTLGFFQSAGTWDLNGLNLTTTAGGTNRGDFQIWNGTSTSVTNLGGRTLTIAGHASFTGTVGNELGINPGSTWNMAVSGNLTARDANIRYSNLTSAAGFATRSTNSGNNTNWNIYGKTHYWNRNDVLTSSTDANKAYNWAYNQDGTGWRPPSASDDYFDGRTLGSSWIFHDTDGVTNTGTYDLTGGQLRISNQGGDLWGTTNQFAVAYRTDMTGDWDVTIKVVDVSPNTGYGKYGFLAADNMRDLVSGGYSYLIAYRSGATNQYSVKLGRAGTNPDQMSVDVTSAATNLSLPIWLRYVKIGTTFHGFYKTTMAGGWTSVGSSVTPVNGAANSHLGIFSCAADAATTKAAYFDDFQAGLNISNTDLTLSYDGTGSNADANSTLSAGLEAESINMANYTGTFGFGSSTLTINYAGILFNSGVTVSAGTGALAITGTTGTQTFYPKSGGTFPPITKNGASTLQLSTNDLTTQGFTMSAGTLDFNGRNITVNNSGNFAVTNGTTSTFTNLGGRTITVAGTTSFAGQAGNLLNMNPGSGWTVASTGALTASYATVGGSTASVSAGVPSNSVNGGSNTNWNFAATDFSVWKYNSRISFNTTSSGANVASDVTDFPFLVRLNAENFIFSQAFPDGRDIRFQDPDGTSLNFTIDRWDAANKLAEVWVKVPTVDGSSDRDYITMFWGNAAASYGGSAANTFGSYKGVFHLGESPGGSAPQFKDSSGTGNHGTAQGGATGDSVTAVIGKGYKLNGSSKYISTTTSYTDQDVVTIGAWFRTVTQSGGKIIGWESAQTGTGGQFDRMVYMGNDGKLNFAIYNGGNRVITTSAAYNDGAWHQVTGRIDGTGMELYVDGASVGTLAQTNPENTTGYWRAGYGNIGGWANSPTSQYFNGSLDEVSFAHTGFNSNYIKLSYQTQKPGSTVAVLENTGLSNWPYSTKININTTASGANITANQSNYPLLVRLNAGNFNFSQGGTTGASMRFADSAGSLLSYEIERYDAANKLAEVWVLVPTVYANNNSQWIRMYWGHPTATSLSSGAAVFLNSAGYSGVWHLNEDGNTTASGYRDASNVENHGTGLNLTNASDVTGQVGIGTNFANGSSQGIHVPNQASLRSNTAITVEAWVNATSLVAYRRVVGKPFTSAGAPWNEFDLELDGTATKMAFSLTLGGTEAAYTSTTSVGTGTWNYFAGTYDGATQKVYANGAMEAGTARTGSINDYAQPLAIGKYYHDNGSNWDGKIDEVRVSTVARSADWLKLCYENMKTGSTVVTVGNATPDYAKSVQFNFNTTNSGGGANVSGNVTNIPILVRLSSANFDFSQVRSDGTDIRFIDKTGAALYHEVVEWDKASQIGKVWVKVPQVDGNSTSDFITAHYGCATCTANPWAVKDSVWSGYNAVYHLNGQEEKPQDVSGYGNHGTYSHALAINTGVTGPMSPYFDGSTNTITVANNTQLDGENITWSFWIKTNDVGNNATWYNSKWILDRDQTGTADDWGVTLNNGNSRLRFGSRNGVLDGTVNVGGGAWHMVHIVKSTTTKWIYVDGAQDVTGASADLLSNDEPLYMMGENGTGKWASGQLNDMWMHPTVRSADFIKLSYENQKESSGLLSTPVTTASFKASKVYRFNTTASGAGVTGDVYDFPLLIRLTDATIIDSTQMSSGIPKDLRFLDADGSTWLPYQVERWDQSANLAEVWVKVPKVDGNSAGDFITMYWNDVTNGAVPDGSCASCVFAPANGFSGVWHLNEDGNNTASGYADATGNSYHGTGSNMDADDDVTGVTGLGTQFNNGADQENISLGTAAGSGSSLTVSFWANATGTANQIPVDKNPLDASGVGWTIKFRSDNAVWFRLGSESATTDITKASGYAAGTWVHVTGTFDLASTTGRLYLNGSSVAVNTSVTRRVNNTTTTLRFSAPSIASTAEKFPGKLDEIQISSVARDSNWVKLTYQTQRSDAAPLFNPSQNAFLASKKYTFNTTRTGANVMADVDNFPLLVRITGSTIVDAVQNDWDDIRFLDGDGKTWLNYSVERWSKALDSAEVWVLVPRVDGNSDQDFITLYYNDSTNAAVANGECASCVFSTSNNFQGVWHLNNSVLTDATSNANNGTNTGSTDGAGVSGSGRSFDGVDDYIHFGNGNSLKNISTAITVDAWIRTTTSASGTLYSVIRHNNHFTALQYGTFGALGWSAVFVPGLSYPDDFTWNGAFDDDAWHHLTVQYRSGDYRAWRDGVLMTSTTSITGDLSTGSASNFIIGATESGNEDWSGRLDEVRVQDVFRDSNFIKLNFETQRRTGNLFWNSRPGPNNKSTLTASDEGTSISLSWTTPVSDSANADTIGIWVKYSGKPDSVGAAGQTKVVQLPKTDSTYSYPARYGGNYYFALAVRNSAGQWSPFTAASTDTILFGGSGSLTDTIYVDSAIGTTSGNTAASCTNARNPATPLKEVEDAVWCAQASGFTPNDTLVVRVMPGIYSSTWDNDFQPPSTYPVVVTSFDDKSRPVLSSAERAIYTVGVNSLMTLRKVDIRAATNGAAGIRCLSSADSVMIDGCRIYNNGSIKHDTGIVVIATGNEGTLIVNNIIHEVNTVGVYVLTDDRTNIIGNTIVGNGVSGSKGISMPRDGNGAFQTFTNNIIYNWDYGIHTTDADNSVGHVANNLFYMVTSANEVVGETDAAKISRDPLFFTTNISNPNAYKLLPGSPAIEAGTSVISTGASQAWSRVSYVDLWGATRPTGSARDIGAYEGTGYTTNPTGEFDTLTNTASGNTVTVKNGKWKLVWDMARGAGITGFYDMTVDSTVNLVGSNSLLFDVKLDAYAASGATSNTLVPEFHQRTRTRSVIRQRLAVSASIDLVVWYTVYASGHIYIQSEISNLSSGTLANMAVGYSAKVGTATAAALSGGTTTGVSFKSGDGYLTTSTRDVLLSVTQDLDLGAAGAAETWIQAGSTAGSLDSVWMGTTDMTDLTQSMKRQHHFLLYVGDGSLDQGKASALAADAYTPSTVDMSAGSLNHERSWQGQLTGHWTLDDGAGSTAKDKSIVNTNDATITSGTWISGKVKGALRFTTSSVASVADNDAFEAGNYRTVMFWVKPNFASMNSDAYVLSKGLGTSDGWHFRRVTSASQIKFTMSNVVLTSPTLATNTWNHLAAVVDGSRYVKLYVNGVLVAASTAAATAATNTNALRMGENGGTNGVDRFAGEIDDVRIYSTSVNTADIQSVYRGGFSEQYGHYYLRADNNNRVVALLNGGVAATRMQPAFRIDNWYGTKTPKYVFLNGVRLAPNTDFVTDSIAPDPAFGSQLLLQVNKVLAGADQTLFVDDNDSTGYLGTAGKMKGLTMSSVSGDKITIRNFADTVFGSATSGQWHLELDLNGWSNSANSRVTDTGFGEFNSWKAAAINPNVALGSATQLVAAHSEAGRSLSGLKFRTTGSQIFASGLGHANPATYTYTLVDSSAARLSLTMSPTTVTASGVNISVTKRWTVYPTGRIFGSFEITTSDLAMTDAQFRLNLRYNTNPTTPWSATTAQSTGRWGIMGGDPDLHSAATGILSVKSNGAMRSSPTLLMKPPITGSANTGGADYFNLQMKLVDSLFEATDDPITVNWVTDISKDFTDSATADSLIKDIQTPAAITALGSGTANPSDALDFNTTPDGFAEGDGAYVYTSGSGVAHFKFVNTVAHFNPAFRIKSWSFSTLPEFVIVDNQTLVKDYQYNAWVNFSTSELIIQFNKTFTPGTHQFFISHKTGLAVTLDSFEALPGEGVDTLKWSTQSEFENLGFHVWRRVAPVQDLPDSLFAGREMSAGTGIANALLGEVRHEAAVAKAAADSIPDTLPQFSYSAEELKAMGYVRINAKLIPGAKGGSSSTTQNYLFVDRTAAYETTYEYLLESVDFSGIKAQFGPRKARPKNPLETVLHSNYPNPFNPVTTLRFSLKEKAKVSLVIYDAKGRMVRVLLRPDKAMLAGKYRLIWDARDDKGFEVPSGQYFYRFSAPKYVKTRKMILVK